MNNDCPTPVSILTTLTVSCSLAVASLFAQPAQAEDTAATSAAKGSYYVADDGNQRINLSGRLRMLSQRIPGMACNSAAGIAPDTSRDNLAAAVAEFSLILHGLEHGNTDLALMAPEESQRVLSGIAQVQSRWHPFEQAAQSVLDNTASASAVAELAGASMPLLQDAQILVGKVVERHYDRVNTIAAEAFTIDFAGRQRMLAQQMSKNICLIHSDADQAKALDELKTGFALFDATLRALQVGMPEVGVSAPPNDTVAEGLAVVATAWDALKPTLERVKAGETLDTATRTGLYHDLNALTGVMNAAVQMYVAASAAHAV